MSFLEYETWKIGWNKVEDHHALIRQWFAFVEAHHDQLFPEWKSARYFQQTDRDGNPTGAYIMLFEFHPIEAHHAYKERRKDRSGPYETYKSEDPYPLFQPGSVTTQYWSPLEQEIWLHFESSQSR